MKKYTLLIAAAIAIAISGGCSKSNQNQTNTIPGKAGNMTSENTGLVWFKTYGGKGIEIAKDIVASPDGGYVMAGMTTSKGAGASDAYLVRIDEQGEAIWDKIYGGAGEDAVYSVINEPGGGYVACGRSDVSKTAGKKNFDLYVIKTAKDGNLMWEKTFGGEGMEEGNCIAGTADNGYIVTGLTDSKGNGNGDVWVVKLSKDGNQEWDKTFGGKSRDYGNSVIQNPDGGFAIAATGGEKNKMYIILLDGTGNPLLEKYIGTANADIASAVIRSKDGFFIVCGMTQEKPNTKVDATLLKMSAKGDILWQTVVKADNFSSAMSVRELATGGFITCGTISTATNIGNGAGIYILTFDENGKNTGKKVFGGSDIDYGNAIVSAPDNKFVFAGYIGYKDPAKAGNFDFIYGKF